MAIHVGYEPAKSCTGVATPGAKALMSYYLARFSTRNNPRAVNLGIYNCKNIAGSSTTSLHGEGRATDLGTAPYGHALWLINFMEELRLNSKELGIQCLIINRRIWSGSYPHAGWRSYNGSNPHTGHGHAELSWWGARNLTVSLLSKRLGGGTTPPPTTLPRFGDASRVLRLANPMMTGTDVVTLQRFIGKPAGTADGWFGSNTEAGVKWYQRMRGISVDGIAGPQTWKQMGFVWRG